MEKEKKSDSASKVFRCNLIHKLCTAFDF